MIVVAGFAADHAAERDVAVETPAGGVELHGAQAHVDRRRNLEGAGHGNPLEAGAGRLQRAVRARQELVRDILVKPGFDNQDVGRIGIRHRLAPRRRCAAERDRALLGHREAVAFEADQIALRVGQHDHVGDSQVQ